MTSTLLTFKTQQNQVAVLIDFVSQPMWFSGFFVFIDGKGGFSRGNAGNGGDSYAIFDADITDGATPEIAESNVLVAGSEGAGGVSISSGEPGLAGWSGEVNF